MPWTHGHTWGEVGSVGAWCSDITRKWTERLQKSRTWRHGHTSHKHVLPVKFNLLLSSIHTRGYDIVAAHQEVMGTSLACAVHTRYVGPLCATSITTPTVPPQFVVQFVCVHSFLHSKCAICYMKTPPVQVAVDLQGCMWSTVLYLLAGNTYSPALWHVMYIWPHLWCHKGRGTCIAPGWHTPSAKKRHSKVSMLWRNWALWIPNWFQIPNRRQKQDALPNQHSHKLQLSEDLHGINDETNSWSCDHTAIWLATSMLKQHNCTALHTIRKTGLGSKLLPITPPAQTCTEWIQMTVSEEQSGYTQLARPGSQPKGHAMHVYLLGQLTPPSLLPSPLLLPLPPPLPPSPLC